MKKLIITADDYGMTSLVDTAIDDCIKAGLVKSTNVIVNQDNFSAAKRLRERFPDISIGLHWNVTSGKPVSNLNEIASLVNPKTGDFWGLRDFMKRFKTGLIIKDELSLELINQYKLFRAFCGEPDYWNVHMNSSLDFKIFPFFNKLARELGITKTRTFQRVYVNGCMNMSIKNRWIERIKKVILDFWFGYFVPLTGTKMPDGRVMYFNSYDKVSDVDNIGRKIVWGKKEIVELVIHPAVGIDHKKFGTLSDIRLDEWRLFSNKDMVEYYERCDIELVNFNAVK